MTSSPLASPTTFPSRRSLREQERRDARRAPRAAAPAVIRERTVAVGRTPRLAAKLLSIGAMLFAGALVVGMSIPAQAVPPADSAAGFSLDWADGEQSFVSSNSADISAARDGFAVTELAKKIQAKYAPASKVYASSATGEPSSGSGVLHIPAPGPVRWPTDVSPKAGNGVTTGHHGQDLLMAGGTPVHAIADGVVLVSTTQYSYGQYVVIQSSVGGHVVTSLYAHMQLGSSPVTPGQTVHMGDVVGLVGSTGAATANLLYLRILQDGALCDTITYIAGNPAGGAAPH